MITGVVLARNEEINIAGCLQALRPHVDELILIDMESEDQTRARADPLVDRILGHPLVDGFDAARNIAIPEAKHEWMWFVDADERVGPAVGAAVRRLISGQGGTFEAILIPFKNYFCGKWIEHCGWWPGYTMPRVLKRGHFRFSERLHEGVILDGRQVSLPPDPQLAVDHFSYRSLGHYIEKFNEYTTREARHLVEDGAAYDWQRAVREMARDLWAYYERGEGSKDGLHGWVLSWLAGQYRWFSHAKLLDVQPQTGDVPLPRDLDEVLDVLQDEISRLRGAAHRDGWGLVLRSPLRDSSGYAEEGRVLLKALSALERDVRAEEIPWSDQQADLPGSTASLIRILSRCRRAARELVVTHCIPSLVEPAAGAACNVLRTTFETDRIPEEWLSRLAEFDEVWVFSEENAESFIRGGAAPEAIRIVPSGVDTELFQPAGDGHPLPSSMEGRFVFLSVFDWQRRKGWDLLLKAYVQAFAANEGAALLLKITRSHGISLADAKRQAESVLQSVGTSLAERGDVEIWDALLSTAELAALYRSVDAFVLPSRGEGWGRPLIEAMASGLPVIGVAGSGNAAFMDSKNSFLIPSEWTPVPEEAAEEIPVYRGHRWREPSLPELRTALREVFSNQRKRRRRANRAAGDVRRHYSLSAVRTSLDSAIEAAENATAPEIPEAPADAPIVQLEGEFFAGHSFSNVNEHLAEQFLKRGEVRFSPARVFHQPTCERGAGVSPLVLQSLRSNSMGEPDVTVRHALPRRADRHPPQRPPRWPSFHRTSPRPGQRERGTTQHDDGPPVRRPPRLASVSSTAELRAKTPPQERPMRNPSVYVKMKVLGAIDVVEGRTRHERIQNVARMTFVDEEGRPHRFTWRTIQTWHYRYKKHGITGMTGRPRSGKAAARKVAPEEVLEAVNAARPHFREGKRPSKSALYRFCIEKGLLRAERIARTTFSRMVREYEMLKDDVGDNKRRLAFSMQHANQLWQADTMFGPYVQRRQAKLIAFLDDASRVHCHGEFFLEENTDAMVRAIRAAFYKRGVPEQLLVDNGSIYCCQEITLICARVGCVLRHTAVRDAAAKGKIERFFRRVRGQFLVRKLDLSSLEALNQQFTHWVERDYNAVEHSTLGMKPIDRFGVDLPRVRFLSPSENADELFYAEAERTVKKDNTFSFRNVRYETPVDVRGRKVQLRYERRRQGAVVVYDNGRRLGQARPLDAVANGLRRRGDAS